MNLLGGNQRKALIEIETHLPAKDAERPGAGAVALASPMGGDVSHQLEVLDHDGQRSTVNGQRESSRAAGGRVAIPVPSIVSGQLQSTQRIEIGRASCRERG